MRQTCVPHKVTRCTKLQGTQQSPKLTLRSTDFCVPENLIFPTLNRCLINTNFLWAYQDSQPPWLPKVTANLKSYSVV